MLGAFTSSFHRDLLEDQTLENQSRNRWTLSKGAAMFFSSGAIRLENLEGTKVQTSSSLVLFPLTLSSTKSSITTLAAKLRHFIRSADCAIGNVI